MASAQGPAAYRWTNIKRLLAFLFCSCYLAAAEAVADEVIASDEAPEHFHKGNRLLHGGDYGGAEVAYKRSISLRPWDSAFYVNLGHALSRQGETRISEAEHFARAGATISPEMARAHYTLGQILLQSGKGRQREGIRRLTRAITIDPIDYDMCVGVGRETLRAGHLDVAIGHLHTAVKLKPTESTPRDQLGYALSKVERLHEAQQWLETAVDIAPSYTAVAKLTEVLLWNGDDDEARKLALRAVTEFRLWRNPLQRPTTLYRNELLAKPWWSPDDAPSLRMIENELLSPGLAAKLHAEVVSVSQRRQGGWRHQPERIQEPGRGRWKEWKVLDDRSSPCRRTLFKHTCELIDRINRIVVVQWGEYSVLEPGAHIRPHTGPTNDRLTVHLCVSTSGGVRIRIGSGSSEKVEYKTGSVLFFDDSFEHEVWHTGEFDRVVLLVQFAHPGLLAPGTQSDRLDSGQAAAEL